MSELSVLYVIGPPRGIAQIPMRTWTRDSSNPARLCTLRFTCTAFVNKADGSWRFHVDYRRLSALTNALTKVDCHPLPLIDETLNQLSHA